MWEIHIPCMESTEADYGVFLGNIFACLMVLLNTCS